MTYIPAIPSFAAPAPDKFTLPGDIPAPDEAAPGIPTGAPQSGTLWGTPSEDWRARGLASPAGRGWEPVETPQAHPAATGARGADASLAPLTQAGGGDRAQSAPLPLAGGGGGGPVEPLESRSTFTRELQRAFLLELSECGQVRVASARAGISYRTAYRERRTSSAFRLAWEAALLSARAYGEDVLACRAIDGVEEVVWFRGEEVGRRVRYDSRLLLAHLARLDRLTEDARTRVFADDLDGALDRYVAGTADPAPACTDCGAALPLVPAGGEGEAATFSPGQCDRCDMPSVKAAEERAARRAAAEPCRFCGGKCNDPQAPLTLRDCRFDEDARFEAMCEARPDDAPLPVEFAGYDTEAVEVAQLFAFEAGVERWWLVVPPREGDDPNEWHWAEDA